MEDMKYVNKDLETMSLDKVKELQLEKLRKMVKFAYENNEVYKEAFDKKGVKTETLDSLDDLAKFPILTKEHLVKHFPYGFLSMPKNQIKKIYMSGGTTGKPIAIFYSAADNNEIIDVASRIYPAAGVLPPDENNKGDVLYHLLPMGSHIVNCFMDAASTLGIPVIPAHFSYNEPEKHLEVIKDFGVTALNIAPVGKKGSNLQGLLEVDEERIIDNNIKTILYAGAPMPIDMMKDLMKKGKTVLGVYGGTEIGGIGIQSKYCSGIPPGTFHVWGDRTLVEIVDDDGKPLKPGQRGYMIVTALGGDEFAGRATPIIRYRTGDEVTLMEGPECGCGRTPLYVSKPKRIEDFSRMDKSCAGEF
ncbi:MAG: AMP-binding protein [Candidatus Nanoarchaeia archaeon]|nr:AMP-binding protein [Candidatus Nanoarchaeia archaeon]